MNYLVDDPIDPPREPGDNPTPPPVDEPREPEEIVGPGDGDGGGQDPGREG